MKNIDIGPKKLISQALVISNHMSLLQLNDIESVISQFL